MRSLTTTTTTTAARYSCGSPSCWPSCSASAPSCIDVGALYAERRQLQNGADAAALAVAEDCAEGDCLDEMATAKTYADSNAKDDAANVDEVCGSGPGLRGLPDCRHPAPPARPAG